MMHTAHLLINALPALLATAGGGPVPLVEEVLVTPAPIFEFEFDQVGQRFCWISVETSEVWVGDVHPGTGGFMPAHGKGVLVDTDAVIPGNGAEWVAVAPTNNLVYTKRLPGDIVRLAQGSLGADGVTWTAQQLEQGDRRVNPAGAPEPVDSMSLVLYFHLLDAVNHNVAWRILDVPDSEVTVPLSLGATGARWVPGELSMVFTNKAGTGRQVFFYDGLTHTTKQITSDSGLKQTVFMWEAPEFPGEKIFFATVKGAAQSQIRIYRYLDPEDDGSFAWTSIKTLNGPSGTYFWSPEPFVHNGKSYIFWVASPVPDQPDPAFPSQIWIASADPADPFYKSLSNKTLSRFRLDPEIFVTDQGPFIYYNRYVQGTPHQYEGVYRVDTGLGPVQ